MRDQALAGGLKPCTLHGFQLGRTPASPGARRQRTPRKTQNPKILQGLSWGACLLDQALAGGLRAIYGPKPYILQGMNWGPRLRDQALAGGLRAARSPRGRRVAQAAPAALPPPRRPLLNVPAEP